jgi:hypothetical protein
MFIIMFIIILFTYPQAILVEAVASDREHYDQHEDDAHHRSSAQTSPRPLGHARVCLSVVQAVRARACETPDMIHAGLVFALALQLALIHICTTTIQNQVFDSADLLCQGKFGI